MNATPNAKVAEPRNEAASRPARPRLTADQRRALRQTVAQRYTAGTSIREIAREVGRSYGLVHRLLQEAKVKRRSRRGRLDMDSASEPAPPTP